MAAREPVITEDAHADVDEIWLYIAEDSVRAADKVTDAISNVFSQLADYPNIGHVREDLTDEPYRFISVYDYLIVYDPTKSPVVVLRVLHGRRDVKSILKP